MSSEQSNDDDVRNYAAMAAASYMDINEVFSRIEKILHNKHEDSNLRWNAFAAMKSKVHHPDQLVHSAGSWWTTNSRNLRQDCLLNGTVIDCFHFPLINERMHCGR
jgi:hypothetical protein